MYVKRKKRLNGHFERGKKLGFVWNDICLSLGALGHKQAYVGPLDPFPWSNCLVSCGHERNKIEFVITKGVV